MVALVLRFRRAGALQRQQIKWFAYGAAPSIPLGMFGQARPLGPYPRAPGGGRAAGRGGIGIGIFRFRLWDIDRLINRTLVYGVLHRPARCRLRRPGPWPGAPVRRDRHEDVELGGGRRHPGRGLFQPARRRVQQAVNLRFNRCKYDAALTIERFSARLRDQVDLDTLSAELLAVVDHTMRPTAASLWLRPSATDAAPAPPFARARVG
jgi:hypothetical protein